MKTNIEILRIANKLTQQELANMLGVSKQAVCEWERNNRIPRIQTLRKLSNLFNTTIDYLLEQGAKPPNSNTD